MRLKSLRVLPVVLPVIGAVLTLGGCVSPVYYRVSDNTSDEVYYTDETNLSKRQGGEMRLRDAKTGRTVTLTSSTIEQISYDEYAEEVGN